MKAATVAIALLLLAAGSALAPESKSQADLSGFLKAEGQGPFAFWTAHPPDEHDPRMAILWVAEAGKAPGEAEGAFLELEAVNSEGLACLRSLERGDTGTLTFDSVGSVRIRGAGLKIILFTPP